MKDEAHQISMQALLERTAAQWAMTPAKIALKEGDLALTYGDLDARANYMARQLADQAARVGDIMVYMGPNGIPLVVTFMACLKVGVTLLPVSSKFPPKSVATIMQTAKARIFVSDLPVPKGAPDMRHMPPPGDEADQSPFAVLDIPEDVLCIANSTSGSTGRPKVVGHSRLSLALSAQEEADMIGTGPDMVVGHAGTSWLVCQLSALSRGACLACYDVDHGTAQGLFDWLRFEKIAYWYTYPALFRTLSEIPGELPDMKTLLLCGEPVFREDFEMFERMTLTGALLVNAYAQQEYEWATAFSIRNGERLRFKKLPAGKPVGSNEMQILDPNGEPVDAAQIGEITHKSSKVPAGYIGHAEQTAKAFSLCDDGMYRFATGDLGYIDSEGDLHHVGRKDDQVKIRNFNVQPADIEHEIKARPSVGAVAVTVNRCRRGLPRLVCFYEGDISAADLKSWLSTRIPSFMMPQFFVPRDALPRTATGKLQRNRLTLSETLSDSERVQARTPDEEALVKIWREVLGHDDFGVTDNFFDVGGDSLRAMEFVLQIEKQFGRLLTLDNIVLVEATIEGLANLIRQPTQKSQLWTIKPGKEGDHLVLGHVYGGGVSDYLGIVGALSDKLRVSGVCADYSRRSRAYPIRRKAREAAAEIPTDPLPILMGFSYGARIAFEIAHQIDEPLRLILMDPVGPFSENLAGKTNRLMNSVFLKSPGLGRERNHWGDIWYRPKQLKVKSVLFLTCETSHSEDVAGWLAALDGPVEHIQMRGNHGDLVAEAHSREIAIKLQDWVARTKP
ncbi:AMP-binding protein [uncultured Shimia sp.]|uniref:AMP-binding protein n=1 Tax=uncultured Shimia sp. TaxID=573152 RepID=UPI00262ABCD3|nr:AMP-binding protein [uncultured Shimia sp.]